MRRALLAATVLPLLLAADAPRRLDPKIPQPAYWFWWPETEDDENHLDQAARLIDTSPFNLLVYTRRPMARPDGPGLSRALKAVADLGRPAGVRLAAHVWKWPRPSGASLGAVSGGRLRLNQYGGARSAPLPPGRVLAAYLLPAGGDGSLDLATAEALPLDQVVGAEVDQHLTFELAPNPARAGRTLVYVLATPVLADVLAPETTDGLGQALKRMFGDAGLAGFVTDELLTLQRRAAWYSSPGLERQYRERFRRDLKEDLALAMFGAGGARIGARGRLVWTRRRTSAAFEGAIAEASRRVCGPDAFTGLHPTYCNFRPGDRNVALEFSRNALAWWDLDRTYSQTDEEHPLPMRLGEARHCTGPVWFNMVYGERADFERHILDGLLYGGRVHYHAVGDRLATGSERPESVEGRGMWGENVDTLDFLAMARRAEGRVRMLNAVQRALPRTDLLVLWGYPDSVGACVEGNPPPMTYEATFRLADALWKAGYLCDVVPTYEIDDRELDLGPDGKVRYHDAVYGAVLWTSPNYATKATLDLVEKYVAGGGTLAVGGTCAVDADGDDAAARFAALQKRAVKAWDHVPSVAEANEALMQANVPRRRTGRSCEMLDGLVIAADKESLFRNATWEGSVNAGGRTAAFDARGLFALALGADGTPERLAAGGLSRATLADQPAAAAQAGQPLITLDGRADVALWREGGRTAVLVHGDDGRVPAITQCAFAGVPMMAAETTIERGPSPVVAVAMTNRGSLAVGPVYAGLRPLAGWTVVGPEPGAPLEIAAFSTARVRFTLAPKTADAAGRGARVVPVILLRTEGADVQLEPEAYLAPPVELEIPTGRLPVALDPARPATVSVTVRNPSATDARRGVLRLRTNAEGWRCLPETQAVEVAAAGAWTGEFQLAPSAAAARPTRVIAAFTPEGGGPAVECRSAATTPPAAAEGPSGQDRVAHPPSVLPPAPPRAGAPQNFNLLATASIAAGGVVVLVIVVSARTYLVWRRRRRVERPEEAPALTVRGSTRPTIAKKCGHLRRRRPPR